jgi:amino acid permease
MDRIVYRASIGGVFVYLLVGIFGYATFADKVKEQLQDPSKSGNILEANYGTAKLI